MLRAGETSRSTVRAGPDYKTRLPTELPSYCRHVGREEGIPPGESLSGIRVARKAVVPAAFRKFATTCFTVRIFMPELSQGMCQRIAMLVSGDFHYPGAIAIATWNEIFIRHCKMQATAAGPNRSISRLQPKLLAARQRLRTCLRPLRSAIRKRSHGNKKGL